MEEKLEKYLKFYDEFDMTREQKLEHIQALYEATTHLVDATFEDPSIPK